MTRGFAPMIGLLAAVLAAGHGACADQSRPGQVGVADLRGALRGVPQSAPRGLANGKDSAALTDFLREHYTTSRDQAAALAAYVLGGRGGGADRRSRKGKAAA